MADESEAHGQQELQNSSSSMAVALKELHCCVRCVLRFLGERNISLYQTVEEEQDVKGSCAACLGILVKSQENVFIDKIQSAVQSAGYQFDNFMFTLSLPLSIILRQHSFSLFLQEKYSSKFDKEKVDKNPTIKEVFKWIYGPIIEELLHVNYKPLGPFKISLVFSHEESEKEVEFLSEPSKSRPRHRRKRQRLEHDPSEGTLTGAAVRKALPELTTVDQLKRLTDCPPKSPWSSSELSTVTCSHDSIYIAGRYNKFSRVLSQTPWIIDDVRHCESSVEEQICDRITAKIMAPGHKFASAGREDVDVRMLGNGRPFLVEFINPRVTRLNESFFEDLQREINSSTTDISVRDLQQVTKEECLVLKDAETNKTKTYRALIWTEKEVAEEQLNKLNETKDLMISQKTPLRVLHRRPLAVRERCIYSMIPAERIDSHHFNLLLKTQAGTYIKEFVHGDFGRTKPNLGELVNTETDILQLDVESVDVEWPPRKEKADDGGLLL